MHVASVLSFQHGQETLFKAGLFGGHENIGGTSILRPALEFGSPLKRASDSQGTVPRRHFIACRLCDPSHQIALCRIGNFDNQPTIALDEGAGRAVEQGLPLMEYHQPIAYLL